MDDKLKETDPSKARLPFSKTSIVIKLDASLNEKLVWKKAVADKLNEQQEILHSEFKDKEENVRRIKEGFKKKEEELLHSIQRVDTYVREIQSLKSNAGDMYEVLALENHEVNLRFYKLEREIKDVIERSQKTEKLLELCHCFKKQLQSIVLELSHYGSVNELVDYYLVLKMLRDDLLNKEKKCQEDESRIVSERKRLARDAQSHPLKVLEKENALYALRTNIKYIHDLSYELEQELDQILSENVKDDIEWQDTDRWIGRRYRMIERKYPMVLEDTKESSALQQLDKIKVFVSMATEVLSRLKQKE